MKNEMHLHGRRIAIRWLLFVLFITTIPTPWFAVVVGGLMPALQLLILGLYPLLNPDSSTDSTAFSYLFLLPGSLAVIIYYLLAAALAYPLANMTSALGRSSLLVSLVIIMFVGASYPIYYSGGHNSGQAVNLLDYADPYPDLFYSILAGIFLLILVLLYLQYRDVAIRGLWRSQLGKVFVLLTSVSLFGTLVYAQFAPWVCMPAAKLGLSSAQVCVGRAIAGGRIADASPYLQSIYWYKLAAEQGNIEAARELYARQHTEKWLRQIAESGDHSAQYTLAQTLNRQAKKQAARREALHWLLSAADNGNAQAQYDLFVLLKTGDESRGIPRDPQQSLQRLKQAASQDHKPALEKLAQAYEHGLLGLPLDLARALSLRERLILKLKTSDSNRDTILSQQQAKLDSIRILNKQIKSSDPHALKKLAFEQLAMRTQDTSQRALDYLEQAAGQDDAGAQYELGKIYAYGAHFIAKDALKAEHWWTQAAANLHVKSMQELARLYSQGWPGVERDYHKAQYYTKQVIQYYQKNLNADTDSEKNLAYWQARLAELQQQIEQIPEGQFAPLESLRRYATGGEVQAQFQLAEQLSIMHGYASLKGEESLYWLEKAAVGGHSQAQWKMFQHKSRGIVVSHSNGAQHQVIMPKNNIEALRYLKMAAARHHPQAMRELSLSYAQGRHGLPIDLDESLRIMTELVAAQEDNRYAWELDEHFKSSNRRFLLNAKNSLIMAKVKRQREANIGSVAVQLLTIESQARSTIIKKMNDACAGKDRYVCRQNMSQKQKDTISRPVNEARDRRIQTILENAADLDKAIWKQVKHTQNLIEARRKAVLEPLIESRSKDFNKVQYQLLEEQLELFKERDKKIKALKQKAGLELN